MKLHYQIDSLDCEKPWIILINGLFASLQSWEPVIEELKKNFQVLRYDCRGQGHSPKPKGPYYLSQHTQDLLNLMEDLQMGRAFLLGISNGGRIALDFSQKHPDRTLAVVAADTYHRVSPLLKEKLISWKEANRIGGPTHRFQVATPWVWGESFLNQHSELLEEYRKKADQHQSSVVEALIDGALEEEIQLNDNLVPILFLAGEEDLLTPPFLHRRMQQETPYSQFQTIPGGHASLLEYPESVEKTATPYLEQFL